MFHLWPGLKARHQSKRGFTLVEIITVLFIMSLGLIGILSLIIQNIQSQNYTKNSLIAYQLGQEGVELIRQVRDTNWLNSVSFRTNLAAGNYTIDYLNLTPQLAGSEAVVLKTDANGFYSHSTGEDSNFSRLITVEDYDGANAMRIISLVDWTDGKRSNSFEVEAILYDWK